MKKNNQIYLPPQAPHVIGHNFSICSLYWSIVQYIFKRSQSEIVSLQDGFGVVVTLGSVENEMGKFFKLILF